MIRYTPGRKADIALLALNDPTKVAGLLKKHRLSPEELATWCERLRYDGLPALRATRVQQIRKREAHA